MTDSFGARLRRERERQHITLTQIAAVTKIKASLFEGLERDDVSRWPGGIFRRSFIRAYAEAIGLNADDICREFTARFPETADPTLPALIESPVGRTTAPAPAVPPARTAPPLAAAPPRVAVDSIAEPFTDRRHMASPPPPAVPVDPGNDEDEPRLRLTLADAGVPTGAPERPASAPATAMPAASPDRQAAHGVSRPPVTWQPLALDLGVILLVAITAFLAFGVFWMPMALASLVYFLGGTALLGRTPGAEFFAATVPGAKPAAAVPAPPAAPTLDRAVDVMDVLRVESDEDVPVGTDARDARAARPYAAIRQPVDIESRRARA